MTEPEEEQEGSVLKFVVFALVAFFSLAFFAGATAHLVWRLFRLGWGL